MFSRTGICLILLTCLAVAVLRPLPVHLFSHLPTFNTSTDTPGGVDSYLFCWNLWWVRGWLTGQHDLLYTTHIFYPDGISLTHHTLSVANGCLAAPVLYLFNPAGCHNLLLIFHSVLTAAGTFLLARYLGANHIGSLIAGAIALLWPGRISHLPAHLNITGTGWIPIALLALFLAVRQRKIRWVLFAGITIAVMGMTSWHHVVSVALITWVILPLEHPENMKKILGFLVISWIVGLLLLSPLIGPILKNTTDIPVRNSVEKTAFSVPVESMITPPAGYPLRLILGHGNDTVYSESAIETTGYTGIIPLLLFIGGLTGFGGLIRKWMAAAGCLMILSLGPVLTVGGHTFSMPYRYLEMIPGFEFGRTPGRFIITAGICIAVGSALLISRIWVKNRFRNGLYTGFLILIILDLFPPALPLIDARIPDIYSTLPTQSGREAILEIPVSWTIRRHQYYQTEHQHPIASGFVSRIPETMFHRMAELPYLDALSNPDRVSSVLMYADPAVLSDLTSYLRTGIVIIHRDLIPGSDKLDPQDIAGRWNAEIWKDNGVQLVLRIHDDLNTTPRQPALYFTGNWYPPEKWDGLDEPVRWARGTIASTTVFAPPNAEELNLKFRIFPAPQKDGKPQVFKIRFNNDLIQNETPLPSSRWTKIDCHIKGPFQSSGNQLQFEFRSMTPPDAFSKAHQPDSRPLSAALIYCRIGED
jgi:hypothetical protein